MVHTSHGRRPGLPNTITRIDPDLPMCWENADTLRIGFERAEARIHSPSAGAQRLLSMLCIGISTTNIARSARSVGSSTDETRKLLRALGPTLQEIPHTAPPRPRDRPPKLRATVFDNGVDVPGLRKTLGACEEWTLGTPLPAERCDLIFHVERYLEPLEFTQRWQAAGVPHLLIRFTDRAVHIGPLIDCAPEAVATGPCHSCLSLTEVDRDTGVPALAAQLFGKRPQSETTAASEMIAAFAAMIVRQWLDQDLAAHVTRYSLPMAQGRICGLPEVRTVATHPDCGCQGI